MEYRVIRSEDRSDDAIEHAIFGNGRQKGAQNKNHKYLARAWIQAKWRYAYTPEEVRQLQNWGKGKLNNLKDKAKEAGEKVSSTAKKASDVATGKYARAVDNKETQAKQNYNRAKEDYDKQKAQAKNATKRIGQNLNAVEILFNTKSGQKKIDQTTNAAGRATENAAKAREAMATHYNEAVTARAKKQTTAYKVSKAVNDTTAKVKSTANKVADTAKDAGKNIADKVADTANKVKDTAKDAANDVKNSAANRYVTNAVEARKAEKERDKATEAGDKKAAIEAENRYENAKHNQNKAESEIKEKVSSARDKGKAKAEELLSNLKKPEQSKSETPTKEMPSSEVTRGRKYEGTGHKAEARKEEGGVAGGPVSGNTNMQGRGEEKKTTLKDKVSDLAKNASNAAEAVKLGAHLTKKNVENYLNDDNGKVVTDTAGKSTLKGQKVTTTYSEGNGLLNKSTLTKKQNEDGTVEYEHHTEYGKIAQTAKKGKEAVENLFGDKKTPKYSITPDKLEEYTPPWLEGYHFKNGKMETDKSVAETFEKGKSKAKEVLDKVSSTAKTTVAKAYDKVTDEIEKVRESDAIATINNTANKVKDKVTDTAEKVADKVEDIKVNAEHKAYANEMKRKYGADSLHYKDAQAYVEHDKTVSDLQKARDKYGVNSAEYKAAAAKEKAAREKMDDVHEQNLYTNNKEYKKVSDQANALGSYIRNMDARGGPQTAEGKANYRKAVQDLEKLEAELERMWNEDWE